MAFFGDHNRWLGRNFLQWKKESLCCPARFPRQGMSVRHYVLGTEESNHKFMINRCEMRELKTVKTYYGTLLSILQASGSLIIL